MGEKCSQSLSLIIPVYNEEKLLVEAVEDCLAALQKDFEDFELILINDGSTDRTEHILREEFAGKKNMVIVSNYINLNQGISIQRAMAMASKSYTVHNGIDLPLKPSEIRRHLETIGDTEVLILQRRIYAGATRWRLLTSKLNILIRKILFPILSKGIRDMNFTQIYKTSIIPRVLPLAKSPAFTTPEMIFRAKVLNLRVKLADADFSERTEGTGSLGKLHDILWTIYDMLRFRYLLWIGIDKHSKIKLKGRK